MREYVKPIVLENEELAEGVYAASGSVGEGAPDEGVTDEAECWTVEVTKEQVVAHEGWANFRVKAEHSLVQHISTASTVVINFSQNITSANFEGFDVSISGSVVTLTRASHGNSYNTHDNYNTLLKVYCEDPTTLSIVGVPTITCTKSVNVQGGFD